MEVRYLPNPQTYRRMTTEELRQAFVLENLFTPGSISMVYCDADRAIIGGAMPEGAPLELGATTKEMAAQFFAERREIGLVNIGGEGVIRTDGQQHTLAHNDMLYIGRGVKRIEFANARSPQAAVFYFVSFPAHATHPIASVRSADADSSALGSPEGANKRTIHRYIHRGGATSCQLVMGMTDLASGSVWNTMPPHTHMRRTEVYLYYNLDPDAMVVHLMGPADETRNLILRNRQAVISPSWSIHCGCGTTNFSFVWAMGGENQEFTDMDGVVMKELQ